MNKFLVAAALLVFAGFGCAAKPSSQGPANTQTYTNTEYSFSLKYPANDEVHVRDTDVRADKYLGKDADFFASLRDTQRPGETAAVNLAYFYALKGVSVADFKQALQESGQNIAVKNTESVVINGVLMTKMTSTTDMGVDKIHYLVDRNGTLLVFSVFLYEDKNFDPILQTLKWN